MERRRDLVGIALVPAKKRHHATAFIVLVHEQAVGTHTHFGPIDTLLGPCLAQADQTHHPIDQRFCAIELARRAQGPALDLAPTTAKEPEQHAQIVDDPLVAGSSGVLS
jgi:hypothetical protein